MSWGALVSVIFWGASFVALKMALNELSPLQLILMRTLLGALALDTVLLWKGQWRRATQLTRRDWTRQDPTRPDSTRQDTTTYQREWVRFYATRLDST